MRCGPRAVAQVSHDPQKMRSRLLLTMRDANLKDDVEERAAIMEYDGGLSRTDAQDQAARAHGFKDWADYEKETTWR